MIVVDANVLVHLSVTGPRTAEAEALLQRDAVWVAPFLCLSELRNVLMGYVRRGQITLRRALALVSGAEDLLREREFRPRSERVLELAGATGCSAYDCEYVALAEELGVALVTSDRQILRAFPRTAVSLDEAGSTDFR